MGAVWYRARTDLRHGVLTTAAIALLIGVVGAVTLAAVAGARRSREAVPAFVEYSRPATAAVFVNPNLPHDEQEQLVQDLVALPQWGSAGALNQPVFSVAPQQDLAEPAGIVASALLDGDYLEGVERPIIVDGHLPDPDDSGSIAVNEAFADTVGLEVGDELTIRSVLPENLNRIINGNDPDPDGEDFTFVVDAITRHPTDLTYDAQAQPGTAFAAFSYQIFLTRAFWQRHGEGLANFGTGVFGRTEAGDGPALEAAALEVGGDNVGVELTNPGDIAIASTQRGVDFEANALLLFAVVVGITGAVLVAQLLGRQLSLGQHEVVELSAIGVRRAQRTAVPLIRASLVAVVGTVLTVVGAVALSPASPIGLARRAEVDRGVQADAAVLVVGGLLIATTVLVFAGLVAWFTARLVPGASADRGHARRRPSRVVRRLVEVGAPVSMVAGVRLALERGRGGRAIPVGSALGVTIAGLFAVSAALVFSASLQDVIESPADRGWNWDVTVGNYSGPEGEAEGQQTLETIEGVAASRGWTAEQISVDDLTLYIGGLGPGDESVGPPVIEGRLPSTADEIALGPGTLADLDKEIGDHVAVEGRSRVDAEIVGAIVPPAVLDSSMTLVRGGTLTLDGLRTVTTGDQDDPTFAAGSHLVRFSDDVDRAALLERLRQEFPASVLLPTIPADIENLRRVQRIPNLVAALVAVLAVATLVSTLVTTVRRRRRELGLLATLGFRRRQIAGTVAWQATTLATIGLVIGIPLGVAAGRAVWRLVVDPFASSLEPTIPTAAIAGLAVVWLLVANVVAFLPARSAARTHPAEALRSE